MLSEFAAHYFDGQTSKAHPVQVKWNGVVLEVHGPDLHLLLQQGEWTLQPPLGRTHRLFHLHGGGRLETADFAAVQRVEEGLDLNPGMRWVSRVEKSWPWVLVGFVVLSSFLWGFFRLGLPALARQAANVTPVAVMDGMTDQTLRVLERQYLKPTRLSAARRGQLEKGFLNMAADIGGGYTYDLRFYDSPVLGANAFALPDGTLIVTDDLVGLAQNDREVLGVLAHEIGHVVHRHGLQSVYQSLGVFLMVSVALGDVVSPTSLGAAFPAVLIQSGYSRNFEREADQLAGQYLVSRGWGTEPLQNLLQRLVDSHGGEEKGITSLLSSHPGVEERLKNLQDMEKAAPSR